jgi:hypothetical protein
VLLAPELRPDNRKSNQNKIDQAALVEFVEVWLVVGVVVWSGVVQKKPNPPIFFSLKKN